MPKSSLSRTDIDMFAYKCTLTLVAKIQSVGFSFKERLFEMIDWLFLKQEVTYSGRLPSAKLII